MWGITVIDLIITHYMTSNEQIQQLAAIIHFCAIESFYTYHSSRGTCLLRQIWKCTAPEKRLSLRH